MGYHVSAMDITEIFKTCISTIRTRNKVCGFPEPERPRPVPRASGAGAFSARARKLMHQAGELGTFIAESSAAYANFSGLIPGAPNITDQERDRIDVMIPRLAEEAKNKLTDLELGVKKSELAPQHREHQVAVIQLIKDYLRRVTGVHTDLRLQRVARATEARRMARLDTQARRDPMAAEVEIPKWTMEEEDMTVEGLSAEELQMFEQENSALQEELTGLVSELRSLEGVVTTVAQLQETLTGKVVEQEIQIGKVADLTAGTTDTLRDANEQLRQAIQRNAGLRVYILFFLLVMSFSLLFLDWYND